jgi:inosine/xanthosine triphosphatase
VPNIVIASTNPVKIQATRQGFEKMFPGQDFNITTVSVPSGVSDQPLSSQETLLGAQNRACQAARNIPQADYWVGIEGGIEDLGDEMPAFAWVVVYTPGLTGKGRTGTFFLPPTVVNLIHQGKELGEADDIVFNQSNSKQANGAIGILTGNVVDRTHLYEHAVIMALVPFKNPELYTNENKGC